MKQKINKFKEFILNLMYPKHIKCVFCDEELNQNEINKVCENCYEILPFVKNPCIRCGSEMNLNQSGVCLRCKTNNYDFITATSIFNYENEIVKAVHGIKYSGKKHIIKPLANFMLEKYATSNIFVDIVTNVPMFPSRLKERGYNQSFLFAKHFADKANLQHIELCEKIKDTVSQTSLNTRERLENIKNSFNIKPQLKNQIKGKSILIIDDVLTTGATTSELSKVLLSAGASKCYILTFASTKLNQITLEQDN